jgi:hypothetical protein
MGDKSSAYALVLDWRPPRYAGQCDGMFLVMNPSNPLVRHSGAGRNPVIKNILRSRQNHDVVPLAWEIVNYLDSGIRRNDAIVSNGLFRMKIYIHVLLER